MELWFSEYQSKNVKYSFKVKEVLLQKKSEYQQISVMENEEFGRVLALDNIVQVTLMDEFVYHEMIAHVPLTVHGSPQKVLIVGGGDGGTLREVLKHPVEKAHLVDIDEEVVKTSKKFFPELSCSYSDPRAEVFHEDGVEFVKKNKGYDVVIIDSTDPIGPGEGLFSKEFYQAVYDCLNADGLMIAQTESPFFYADFIKRVYGDISSIYKYTNLITAVVPTYPGAYWTFTMGSKSIDPVTKEIRDMPDLNTKYYSREIHKSSFILPPFLQKLIS